MTLLAFAVSWEFVMWILLVAVGLGAVIFVHELGHFLVAKACGVKCEKFFIGFDIGGIKLSRRWGETEYGIGILPIGGYVKMLGQDDNPAKIAQEMERSRIRRQDATGAHPPADGEDPGDFELDPRSYLAKGVPQRMAIIAAGVVMNVIFAFLFAVVAYAMGVKYLPCVVSEVIPGSPAWQADLRVGDEIVQIGDVRRPRFRDLKSGVSLGNPQESVPLLVRRPGVDHLLPFTLTPCTDHGLPTIGIVSPRSLTLAPERPYLPGSPAAHTEPALAGGDEIVAVGGEKTATYRDLVRIMAQQPDESLDVTVRRPPKDNPRDVASLAGSEITVRLAANPMKRLGLVMACGPITAIQANSPAAEAGLKPGDTIEAIDDGPLGDPMTLPERLRRRAAAGDAVRLSLARPTGQGGSERLEKTVTLRQATWFQKSDIPGTPVAVPSLGIAYDVLNHVRQVEPDSPAAERGVVVGDEVVEAKFIPDPHDTSADAGLLQDVDPIPLSDKDRNWPAVMSLLAATTPGTTVRLTLRNGRQALRDVHLRPVASTEWFNPDRGLVTGPAEAIHRAESVTEALVLATRETEDSLLIVFRFLKRLLDRQISPRLLGGPVTIAKVAFDSASGGIATLLIFLTLLSANLAVINFLPIPLLDGGHIVLLALEAILRRPVSEKIVIALHTIGFVFIIGVMLFVLALDVGLISRGL